VSVLGLFGPAPAEERRALIAELGAVGGPPREAAALSPGLWLHVPSQPLRSRDGSKARARGAAARAAAAAARRQNPNHLPAFLCCSLLAAR